MDSLVAAVRKFAEDEDGITAIEYGLIAALIVVAIATSLTGIGTALTTKFTAIATALGVSSSGSSGS